MKNILCLFLMALSLSFVACDKQDSTPSQQPGESVTFAITSEKEISMPAEGGTFVITYTIDGDHTGVVAEADNSEVVTALNSSQQGVIIVSVSANSEFIEREATIRVSFDGESDYVVVKQEAANGSAEGYEVVYVDANQVTASYYGDRLINDMGRYWLIFSKDGFTDEGLAKNAEFFRVDILGPMPVDEGNITIPDGTYLFEYEPSFTPYTMLNLGNTDYVYTDESGEAWSVPFTEAQLIITGNTMKLVARTTDKEFHLTYEGDYAVDYVEVPEYISTLTDDYEIDLSHCEGELSCYGDYWECGVCNWCIEFLDVDGMKYGTYLVLDFLTDEYVNGSSGITGTYRSSGFTVEDPTKPAFAPYTYVPGMRISDDGNLMMGSLLQVYSDGVGVVQAPIFDGTITLKENTNGTYTIVIDALDDAEKPNRITLNWTGDLY
jgi:hypothetical protein